MSSEGPAQKERAFRERDSRLTRYLLVAVVGGSILLFGSNSSGLWETPGQREARIEAARTSGQMNPSAERQRVIAERREVDRQETQRLALEREAQRKAADDEAGRRARDDAARRAAEDTGQEPPPPRPPNLADTDCQTTRSIDLIVASCSEIISRFSDFADAYYVRGWALRERNQPERALTDFNRALELAPRRGATLSQRALTYARIKEYDKALVDYDRALELEPRSAPFFNDRGLVYLDLKDYKRAIADFDQAITIDPRYAIPYNNRSRAYVLASNDHARAIADLNRAIELNPKYALAFENRAFSYLDTKDLPKAIADFSTSIEINPRSARALNGRGVAYERHGSRDLALSDYRRALEIDTNFSVARQNLTRLGEKP
jgi:tetratricopeptide (TPR) repeat protein